MLYDGYNGKVVIEQEHLVVLREGMVARAAFGKDTPPRRIPLRAISGVAFQDASRLKNGWLTIGLGGADAPTLGVSAAASNADTVMFTHKHREQFEQLRAWLADRVVPTNRNVGFEDIDVPDAGGQAGRFDKKAVEWEKKAVELEAHAAAAGERAQAAAEAKQQERQAKGEASGLRPDIAEAAARMGWRLGGGREIKKLQTQLNDGESVRFIAQGTYGNDQGIVVLTDSRLLFYFHGLTRQALEDYPLRSISSVQSKAGMATGELTVHASGNNATITHIVKPDLKFLADALRQHLAAPAASSPGAASPAPAAAKDDVMDQLRKLAELRDAGIVTPEEFDAKKKDLLARM